jgi:hypothetical protein
VTYVNFIIIVITVSEEKVGSVTYVPRSYYTAQSGCVTFVFLTIYIALIWNPIYKSQNILSPFVFRERIYVFCNDSFVFFPLVTTHCGFIFTAQ